MASDLAFGTAHYLSVRGGGRLKSRGGGHMNFHVASRGDSPLNLASQQGVHV